MTSLPDSYFLAARAALPADFRLVAREETVSPGSLFYSTLTQRWGECLLVGHPVKAAYGFIACKADAQHPPEGYMLKPAWVAPAIDDLVWAWGKGPWQQTNNLRSAYTYSFMHPRAIKAPVILSATCPPSGYSLLQAGDIMAADDLMWWTEGGSGKWVVHSSITAKVHVAGSAFARSLHLPRARLAKPPFISASFCVSAPWTVVRCGEVCTGPTPLPAGFYALPKGEMICRGDKYFSKALSCWCQCVASVGQKVSKGEAGWYARENGHGLWNDLRIKFDESTFPTWKTNVAMPALASKIETAASRAAAKSVVLPAEHRWLETGEIIKQGDLYFTLSREWEPARYCIGGTVDKSQWARPLPRPTIPPTVPIPFGYRLLSAYERLEANDLARDFLTGEWVQAESVVSGALVNESRPCIRPVWVLLIPSGWHQLGPTERLQDGDMVYMTVKQGWQYICNPDSLSNARECGGFADTVYIRRRPAPAPEWPCILESDHEWDRGTLVLANSARTGTILTARRNSVPAGRYLSGGEKWRIEPGYWRRHPDLGALLAPEQAPDFFW